MERMNFIDFFDEVETTEQWIFLQHRGGHQHCRAGKLLRFQEYQLDSSVGGKRTGQGALSGQ